MTSTSIARGAENTRTPTVAVIADQSSWGKLRVTGADRRRLLQGMITNDLDALTVPGAFCRAAVLNIKGRVLGLVDVVLEEAGQAYLVMTEPGWLTKVQQVLAKHAIMDDVEFTPVDLPCHRIWDTAAAVWTAPPIMAAAEGSSETDVEVRRVEAGLPRYGIDVSEDHFPFEANLESAISYKKGCYVGQEVVARAHARGHANKRLMGIRVLGTGAPIARGAVIATDARADAGIVTSSVASPLFGEIGLGYVHKTAWEPGTKVQVGGREGVVTALPFA